MFEAPTDTIVQYLAAVTVLMKFRSILYNIRAIYL